MDFQGKVQVDARPRSAASRLDRWVRQHLLRHALAVARLVAAALACALAGPPARAADIPTDSHGFTAYVAAQFQKALPGTKIATPGDLKLLLTSSGRDWNVSLDDVYGACGRSHTGCAEYVAAFVTNASSLLDPSQPGLDLASLRVVLRPSSYVDSLRSKKVGLDPVATPVEGDFWMVVARDLPTSIQPLDKKALVALHLSPDEAFAAAKVNMSAQMRDEIRQIMKKPLDSIGLVGGDDYLSSLFAFPDMWTPLAQALHGNLLVAVPTTDIIVFEDARHPGALEKVAGTAQIAMSRSVKTFSADVFRWTPDGWQPMPEPAEKRP